MTEDKKTQDISVEDTIASIKNAAETTESTENSQDLVDSVLDLTETEMVDAADKKDEELIDIKSFDETGEIKQADEGSELLAKAQHGDDDAIAALTQSLKADDDTQAVESDDLSSKAQMLEQTSKTYSSKDFSGSQEYEGEDDVESTNEEEEPQAASFEDLAAAMATQTKPTAEELAAQQINTQELANKVTSRVSLKAVPGATGLQVGFPVEVLAEALRPMIAGWVEENLPVIVEKLVKEELSKLADK